MIDYVIPFEAPASLPVRGLAARFPVRRIYCVGRNYSEHVREMGGDPERERPFFFQKPADSIVEDGQAVPYPGCTHDFQHEVELLLAIDKGGSNIAVEHAAQHVYAIGVAIDLTRRDVQVDARKTGRPWEIGKSFDRSAPCSDLVPIAPGAVPVRGRIALSVNGVGRQEGDLAQMVWSSAEIIHHLSTQYELRPGDLIMTGTPAGVGPLQRGDFVDATLEGVASLSISIV
ncbi:fumarylacetoacetate hydrolase family protein [Burkholderia mayonis]|uniref:Fumarylacetoacetate hydrolase n=1 Tax=Burkholderia mayonis TaxID=1385591 RepID=A0A1B4G3R4_9BURK|nr:fumarylacetoacetate hydrolase family protein [Burkholderia mayonis]AOJ10544.1 fumarylacetoacetate hydrolase [Burkholderia mayonis]KVE57171.1 fumarylacetoacetate hydrolase [Burkholderia mayonis]